MLQWVWNGEQDCILSGTEHCRRKYFSSSKNNRSWILGAKFYPLRCYFLVDICLHTDAGYVLADLQTWSSILSLIYHWCQNFILKQEDSGVYVQSEKERKDVHHIEDHMPVIVIMYTYEVLALAGMGNRVEVSLLLDPFTVSGLINWWWITSMWIPFNLHY